MRPAAEKTRSKDDIGFAFEERFEQCRVFVRVIFEIGILNDDVVAGRFLDAAAQGCTLAHVVWLKIDLHPRMLLLKLGKDFPRVVAGTVVDADELDVERNGEDFSNHFAQGGAFVVYGHDDGKLHRVWNVHIVQWALADEDAENQRISLRALVAQAILAFRRKMKTLRNLRLLVGAILLVIAVGTVGFHYIEGWPWFDGFYMVITTLTTIGYQETHPLSHAGRVFNVLIILGGVSLVFLTIGALTQALLEFELQNFFGRRRMQRDIGRLSGHYIICGAGRVGRSVAHELARRPAPFVIIENNEAKGEKFASENWLVMVGDATSEQTLRDAQIERALGLVAATTTDATNLYIVLTARGLNPHLRIIARASEDKAEKHLLTAGADSVVSPYIFAGQRIAHSFLRPNVVSFLDTATTHLGMDLEIDEVPIGTGSPFAGATIEKSRIRQDHGVIILAIKRASGMRFNPSPEDRIEAGDFLIAMGEPQQLRVLEQMAEAKL